MSLHLLPVLCPESSPLTENFMDRWFWVTGPTNVWLRWLLVLILSLTLTVSSFPGGRVAWHSRSDVSQMILFESLQLKWACVEIRVPKELLCPYWIELSWVGTSQGGGRREYQKNHRRCLQVPIPTTQLCRTCCLSWLLPSRSSRAAKLLIFRKAPFHSLWLAGWLDGWMEWRSTRALLLLLAWWQAAGRRGGNRNIQEWVTLVFWSHK